ncbi:hypothetical protein ACLM5H_23640 [Fredinandcohnia humi]
MMRNGIFIIGLFLTLFISGCSSYSKYPNEIEKAYNYVDPISKETIINWKKAAVKNYTPPEYFEVIDKEARAVNIKGIETLEITFKTTDDGTVGPIIVYTDKQSKKILGTLVRK